MTSSGITRRQWLIGSGCLGLSLGMTAAAETPGFGVINIEPYPRNADETLVRLKNGNRRFMDEKPSHAHENASWRSLLVDKTGPEHFTPCRSGGQCPLVHTAIASVS